MLKSLREKWEKGLSVKTVVVDDFVGDKIVYVVLGNDDQYSLHHNKYSLHRYFKLGQKWNCSVDMRDVTIGECLTQLTSAFKDQYPKDA